MNFQISTLNYHNIGHLNLFLTFGKHKLGTYKNNSLDLRLQEDSGNTLIKTIESHI